MYKGLRNKITGHLSKAKANFLRQAKGTQKCYGKVLDQLSGKERLKNGPIDLRLNGITKEDSLAVCK